MGNKVMYDSIVVPDDRPIQLIEDTVIDLLVLHRKSKKSWRRLVTVDDRDSVGEMLCKLLPDDLYKYHIYYNDCPVSIGTRIYNINLIAGKPMVLIDKRLIGKHDDILEKIDNYSNRMR